MNINVKLKQLMLLLGDIVILYASLVLTLFLRYGQLSNSVIEAHLGPFTVVFAVSLVAASGIVAIFFFYFIPAFGIAPKTNLFIVLAVVGLGGYAWRTFCNNI